MPPQVQSNWLCPPARDCLVDMSAIPCGFSGRSAGSLQGVGAQEVPVEQRFLSGRRRRREEDVRLTLPPRPGRDAHRTGKHSARRTQMVGCHREGLRTPRLRLCRTARSVRQPQSQSSRARGPRAGNDYLHGTVGDVGPLLDYSANGPDAHGPEIETDQPGDCRRSWQTNELGRPGAPAPGPATQHPALISNSPPGEACSRRRWAARAHVTKDGLWGDDGAHIWRL
jgi:hypothetical protein